MIFFCVCESFKFIRDLFLYPARLVVALVRCCCTISFRTRNLEDFQDLFYISRSLEQATQADTKHKKISFIFPAASRARELDTWRKKFFRDFFLLLPSSWQIYCHQSGSVQVKWVRMSTRRLPTISSLKRTKSSEKSTMMRTLQVAVWWQHWWVFLSFLLCLSVLPVKPTELRATVTTNFPSLPNGSLLKLIYEKIYWRKNSSSLYFVYFCCCREFSLSHRWLFIVWLPLITLCVTLVIIEHALFPFAIYAQRRDDREKGLKSSQLFYTSFLTFYKSSGWGNDDERK